LLRRADHMGLPSERANVANASSHRAGEKSKAATLRTIGLAITTPRINSSPIFFILTPEDTPGERWTATAVVTLCEVS